MLGGTKMKLIITIIIGFFLYITPVFAGSNSSTTNVNIEVIEVVKIS